jgi:hypothetical protein
MRQAKNIFSSATKVFYFFVHENRYLQVEALTQPGRIRNSKEQQIKE